jgi:hypothetical protein
MVDAIQSKTIDIAPLFSSMELFDMFTPKSKRLGEPIITPP